MHNKSKMATKAILLLACFSLIVSMVHGTQVRKCEGSTARKLTTDEISLSNCKKGTCKLKQKTTAKVEIKFTPEKAIKELTTTVQAKILDIPLPFVGVDGTSACNNIYKADGTTKVSCPLAAGETYVYKNEFPILEIYPKINLVVHWALTNKHGDLVCFEVPARIV